MIKIALVDDHQLFRKSLVLLLASFQEIEVVFDTPDGLALLDYAATGQLDMVLLDIQMPLIDGFDLCKRIKTQFPDCKVLILSQLTSREAIRQIMEVGADGFFTKNTSPELLENAIRSVYNEDYYFDMELSDVIKEALLWDKITSKQTEVLLSTREIEIVALAAQEKCSKEIADRLTISSRTVEKHRKHMMEKTQSKNFIGVILYALKNNLI
jgi:DNA-binding NarL/FixJ family response regulator